MIICFANWFLNNPKKSDSTSSHDTKLQNNSSTSVPTLLASCRLLFHIFFLLCHEMKTMETLVVGLFFLLWNFIAASLAKIMNEIGVGDKVESFISFHSWKRKECERMNEKDRGDLLPTAIDISASFIKMIAKNC
jgi:hypothetical protein